MTDFISFCWNTWANGGIMMIPLAVLAFFIFWNILSMIIDLHSHIGKKVGKSLRKEVLEHVHNAEEIHEEFTEKEKEEMDRFNQWFAFTNKLVSAAPLIGLLGTVTGMIYLFANMGGGGDIAQQLATGISRALFPPALGLVIAMFGMFGLAFVKSKLVDYDHFFMRMERKATQKYIKSQNEELQ